MESVAFDWNLLISEEFFISCRSASVHFFFSFFRRTVCVCQDMNCVISFISSWNRNFAFDERARRINVCKMSSKRWFVRTQPNDLSSMRVEKRRKIRQSNNGNNEHNTMCWKSFLDLFFSLFSLRRSAFFPVAQRLALSIFRFILTQPVRHLPFHLNVRRFTVST